MKRHTGMIILVLLVVAVLLLGTVAYAVDETKDTVLITRFGRIDRVIDGADNAGLHFKFPWPIERVVKFDSRNHTLNLTSAPYTIGQSLMITAMAYCTWEIADAEQFYRAKRDQKVGVERGLETLVSSELTNVLGQYDMAELVNTNLQSMKLAEIAEKVKAQAAVPALRDYGVTITSVGIEQLGLPKDVATAVTNAMKADREKEASRYRSEGMAAAQAIVSRAEAAKTTILAFTDRKAGEIRTQGKAEAAKAYTQFQKDPEFAMFLRSLDTLRASLSSNTVFVMDSHAMPVLQWRSTKPTLKTFESPKK